MKSDPEVEFDALLGELDEETISELTGRAKDLCALGAVLFRHKSQPSVYHHIPLSLMPSPFPRELYNKAQSIQNSVNALLLGMSRDHEFLRENLRMACKEDPFTDRLVKIMDKAESYPHRQDIQIGIIRSDYMVDDHRKFGKFYPDLRLIEYNTVSVSFGAHSSKIPSIHCELVAHLKRITQRSSKVPAVSSDPNPVLADHAKVLAQGWDLYVKKYCPPATCILFITQEGERNSFDQLKVQYATHEAITKTDSYSLKENNGPAIFFITLNDAMTSTTVDEASGSLLFRAKSGDHKSFEVAIVYFRSGYSPSDYYTEHHWTSRERLELCRAIKVPSIGLHLTGMKKIQQVLSEPGVVEKYISVEESPKVRSTYAGIYSLDDNNVGLEFLLKTLKSNPHDFVLKPQREGGGNNYYGDDMMKVVEETRESGKSLGGFILMDLIRPTVYKNYLVFPNEGKASLSDCVSELGIFGMYVFDGTSLVSNTTSGYLLRTKSIEQKDGGVASGRAALDSISFF